MTGTLAKAVLKFEQEHRNKTFSERNTDLGKMIKCQVCGLRHRSVIQCEQVMVEEPKLTRKSVLRSVGKLGKRIHPHPNKRGLQLIEHTRRLFLRDYPAIEGTIEEAQASMKLARGRAFKLIQKAAKALSRRVRLSQRDSRRSNRCS